MIEYEEVVCVWVCDVMTSRKQEDKDFQRDPPLKSHF